MTIAEIKIKLQTNNTKNGKSVSVLDVSEQDIIVEDNSKIIQQCTTDKFDNVNYTHEVKKGPSYGVF
jgi:hypothetical protein